MHHHPCTIACGDGNHGPIVYACEANVTVGALMFVGSEGWEGGKHCVVITYSAATPGDLLSKCVLWNK